MPTFGCIEGTRTLTFPISIDPEGTGDRRGISLPWLVNDWANRRASAMLFRTGSIRGFGSHLASAMVPDAVAAAVKMASKRSDNSTKVSTWPDPT